MLFAGHLLGKYKVVSTLGSGGFGTVYLAEDTWLDKKVALKIPHRQEQLTELLREPRLLARLDHPNIVAITTAEKQQNIFFDCDFSRSRKLVVILKKFTEGN